MRDRGNEDRELIFRYMENTDIAIVRKCGDVTVL